MDKLDCIDQIIPMAKIRYDEESDTLHVIYGNEFSSYTTEFSDNIILEFSMSNKFPIGIKILHYKEHLRFLKKLAEQRYYIKQEILKEFPDVTITMGKDLDSEAFLNVSIYNLPNDHREKFSALTSRLYKEFYKNCNASVSFFDYTIDETKEYYPEYAKKEKEV